MKMIVFALAASLLVSFTLAAADNTDGDCGYVDEFAVRKAHSKKRERDRCNAPFYGDLAGNDDVVDEEDDDGVDSEDVRRACANDGVDSEDVRRECASTIKSNGWQPASPEVIEDCRLPADGQNSRAALRNGNVDVRHDDRGHKKHVNKKIEITTTPGWISADSFRLHGPDNNCADPKKMRPRKKDADLVRKIRAKQSWGATPYNPAK